MQIGPQAYVRGSIGAAQMYCKAFGAQASFEIKDEAGRYAHCELSVDGRRIMALSEAPEDCDLRPRDRWQVMAFNAFDLKTEEAVKQAYDILREGGTVIHSLGACP